jgi:alkylation response protein AidB-like acyl-CoA dehydrogenase
MQIETDRTAAFVADTLAALGAGREDATLRVLEVKAAAAESVIDVTDLAMVACGGAAFRKELGVERRFRDARAARVMAPTTQALHDIVGRALLGLPLLGDVSEPSATESPGGGERGPSGPARSAESGGDVT